MMSKPVAPDEEVEGNAISEFVNSVLTPPQIEHLQAVVTNDPAMAEIFNTVIVRAVEVSDEGVVEGPGDGTSDEVLSRLSTGEFVFSAKAVSVIGEDVLQQMMEEAEAQAEPEEEEMDDESSPSLLSRTA